MKKYFLSITSVLIAVTLSAFTLGSGDHIKSDKPLTNLYWYLFDGTRITSQVGSSPMSKPSAESATSCTDNAAAEVCSFGYSNQQTGFPKAPGSFNDKFNKSN